MIYRMCQCEGRLTYSEALSFSFPNNYKLYQVLEHISCKLYTCAHSETMQSDFILLFFLLPSVFFGKKMNHSVLKMCQI